MNFNMFNLLASNPLPDWVTTLFPILQIVFICLIVLCAIGIIVLVFMQESNSGGLGSLGGSASESNYYGQNKSDSKEYRLKKWTYILAGAILLFAVLYFVSFNIVNFS